MLSQPSDTNSTAPTFGCVVEPLHHLLGIAVRIAARKADQVNGRFVVGGGIVERIECRAKLPDDLARDVMRAFDEIRDRDHIANALAAIGAQIALKLREWS